MPDYSYSSSPFDFMDADMAHTPVASTGPFQMPSYLYSNAPALASGGGAEVLPFGMLNEGSWLANNGFLQQQQNTEKEPVYRDLSYEDYPTQPTGPTGIFDFDQFIAPVPLAAPSPTHPSFFTSFQQQESPPQAVPLPPPPPPAPPPPAAAAAAPSSNQGFELVPPHHRYQQSLSTGAVAAVGLPSALGLPVYSATGFDVLTILSRVHNRPYPRVQLGPVDFTCSFVVVDTRRHDHPIIYCSPNFCKLTGYEEREILGRNCRFLQSPRGVLEVGGARPDASAQQAAGYLKKSLGADKECQTVITNYKKDGTAFSNLLTVIPIPGGVANAAGEEGDVVFHVGFQIDLMEQPRAILENMKMGSYLVDYVGKLGEGRGREHSVGGAVVGREKKAGAGAVNFPPVLVSKEMKKLLANPDFLKSVKITTKTNVPVTPLPGSGSSSSELFQESSVYGGNHPLHLMLLEVGPDFVHVVSLKGSFLYVAPSVRRVLGYEPEDLVGASIADLAHPEDVVPLMRELKESSSVGVPDVSLQAGSAALSSSSSTVLQNPMVPRTVDLMFRAKTKSGVYVWVESRGRLHVEPGKGRKAIILSGRAREMSNITWETIAKGGGVAKRITVQRPVVDSEDGSSTGEMEDVVLRQDFWGTMSASSVLLMIGSGIKDVLGYAPSDFFGRSISTLLVDSNGALEAIVKTLGANHNSTSPDADDDEDSEVCRTATCRMKMKEGGSVVVVVNVFRCKRDVKARVATSIPGGIIPAHLIYQVRLASAETFSLYPPHLLSTPSSSSFSGDAYPDMKANVFEALDIKRGSSWQYELQQLKFGNQRLAEEIAVLRAAIQASKARKAAGGPSSQGTGSLGYGQMHHPNAHLHPQQHHQQPQHSRQQQRQQQRRLPQRSLFPGPPPMRPAHHHLPLDFTHQASPPQHSGGLSISMPFPTAALPMRTPSSGHGQGGIQGMELLTSRPSRAAGHMPPPPPSSSSASNGVGGGARGGVQRAATGTPGYRHQAPEKDYSGTSPYVQRVQNDVAQSHAAAAAAYYGSSSGGTGSVAGVKRTWGSLDGHERLR